MDEQAPTRDETPAEQQARLLPGPFYLGGGVLAEPSGDNWGVKFSIASVPLLTLGPDQVSAFLRWLCTLQDGVSTILKEIAEEPPRQVPMAEDS